MKGYSRYSQAYKKAAVSTVDQKKLIIMLYDGAIRFLSVATGKIEKGDIYEAHKNLIRGKSIIAELLASLNMEGGGEIARNLQRLYTYMFNELIEANLNSDVPRVNMVVDLLKELRAGWDGIENGATKAIAPQEAIARETIAAKPGRSRKSINLVY